METQYIIKVGSKGEIFPPKEVREYLGFQANQTLILKVYRNRLILEKFIALEEILKEPSTAKISYHALKQIKSEFE
ncbi:MAG: AbrB/MazE/SpoVT family DNA-binding domain-containing protein [Promethearchaeota archaeon]